MTASTRGTRHLQDQSVASSLMRAGNIAPAENKPTTENLSTRAILTGQLEPIPPKRNMWLHLKSQFGAFPWIGPALVLVLGVVVYPVIALAYASFSEYSLVGLRKGDAGWANYAHLLSHPALPQVILNTIAWVFGIVTITIVLSLGLAQFLSKPFFGRRLVRWSVLLPWASSLVITSQLMKQLFDNYHGLFTQALVTLGLIPPGTNLLAESSTALAVMIGVGIFVSLPFTTFLFIAGLTAVPHDVLEAAKMDGASAARAYWHVTLPLLRPAVVIGIVLNIIGCFNSFPIVWVMNSHTPGFSNDILITFMYKLGFKTPRDIGLSSATSLLNVGLIIVIIILYALWMRRSAKAVEQ